MDPLVEAMATWRGRSWPVGGLGGLQDLCSAWGRGGDDLGHRRDSEHLWPPWGERLGRPSV